MGEEDKKYSQAQNGKARMPNKTYSQAQNGKAMMPNIDFYIDCPRNRLSGHVNVFIITNALPF